MKEDKRNLIFWNCCSFRDDKALDLSDEQWKTENVRGLVPDTGQLVTKPFFSLLTLRPVLSSFYYTEGLATKNKQDRELGMGSQI